MPNVNFLLKTPNEPESLIFAKFNYGYSPKLDAKGRKIFKSFKYFIGDKIISKDWIKDNQRAKETNLNKKYSELNKKINNIENEILNLWRKLSNDGQTPTPELLKTELDKILDKIHKPQPEPLKLELFPFIDNFIKTVTHIYKNGKPYPISKLTLKKYRTTLTLLKEFAQDNKKYKNLDFDNINLDFYKDLLEYMERDKQYSYNYCGKHIATLKTFLNKATEEEINTKLDYKSKRFAVPSEDVDKIYLTESELLKLYKLDLTNNKKLESVRDLFLIGCYTALRFSDFTNIKPENIVNNDSGEFIKIKTFKTGDPVTIPLHWIVKEILNKYSNNLPSAISNQKMNDYLKDIGKLSGLKDKVSLSITKGGYRVDTTKHKYELITTHTARRTGATNMYLAGIPQQSIMIFTGHKSEKSFMTYLKFTEADNANLLMNSSFFKQSKMLVS